MIRMCLFSGLVDCDNPAIDTDGMKKISRVHSTIIVSLMVYSASVAIPASAFAPEKQVQRSDIKDAAARLALDTLSKQISVDAESISVVHVSVIDWPDSSLGCPSAGTQYLQVVTRGSLVLLKTSNKVFRVHIGNNRAIVCEKPSRGAIPGASRALAGTSIQGLMQAAKQDLAKRLGAAPSEIFVTKVESMNWPNTALGCPVAGTDYIDSKVKGFRITLSRDDQVFTYHSDQQNVVPCPAIESE